MLVYVYFVVSISVCVGKFPGHHAPTSPATNIGYIVCCRFTMTGQAHPTELSPCCDWWVSPLHSPPLQRFALLKWKE